jgi:macrolide transport system ATP-binding/permease protein
MDCCHFAWREERPRSGFAWHWEQRAHRCARFFVRQTLAILFAGAIPGAGLAVGIGYMARKLLYGAGTMDLWALGFAFCVLGATGLLATHVPAHRAASIDPMQALRSE